MIKRVCPCSQQKPAKATGAALASTPYEKVVQHSPMLQALSRVRECACHCSRGDGGGKKGGGSAAKVAEVCKKGDRDSDP